jgi:hypothetical protein
MLLGEYLALLPALRGHRLLFRGVGRLFALLLAIEGEQPDVLVAVEGIDLYILLLSFLYFISDHY